MSKYVTVAISNVITQVAEETDVQGYTKGVIESLMPDDEELSKWSVNQQRKWIAANNRRMRAICDFLNEKNI